uniref:phosphoribosyltransferase-like protein n=1 Tax=uncultured Acinetobacter sp. TaxID=165433 RepID=UPI00260E27AD|nr:hypothetical protein [uncultured Acinetobacter sp.]
MVQFLSDTDFAKNWLNQFENATDRYNAKKLLNSLKYISNTDFETFIYEKLDYLKNKLNKRLAVYPVITPLPENIAGSKLFTGKFQEIAETNAKVREDGKRRQYGSEDRVGHILEKVSSLHRGNGSVSDIECCPTVNTLIRQGIKDIVFVDDICGSGERFVNFFKKVIPSYLKRLISINKIRLWFVCYGITSSGLNFIKRKIKYFKTHPESIISNYSPLRFDNRISSDVRDLCFKYTRKIYGNDSASLGYKNTIGGIVFEHGCPNNLPRILWDNNKSWNALFKNRSIPIELRPNFSEENLIDTSEILWDINQKNLAISILDSIQNNNIEPKYNLIITFLGLANRGIHSKSQFSTKLFVNSAKVNALIDELIESDLIIEQDDMLKMTLLGKCVLQKYKKTKLKDINSRKSIDSNQFIYYPHQCDGHFRFLVDC